MKLLFRIKDDVTLKLKINYHEQKKNREYKSL